MLGNRSDYELTKYTHGLLSFRGVWGCFVSILLKNGHVKSTTLMIVMPKQIKIHCIHSTAIRGWKIHFLIKSTLFCHAYQEHEEQIYGD